MLPRKEVSGKNLLFRAKSRSITDMERAEIKRIGDFLSDVYEGICEGEEPTTMQQQLTELYGVIKRLMDLTSKAPERKKHFFGRFFLTFV